MSITIKKDVWRIKDSNGVFHSTDLFSTMLPNEAQQLISETRTEFANIENEVNEVLENLEDAKQELITEGIIQKNAVASEAANRIAAVNTKGQEVLASIPSDYTELTKTVESIARGGFIYDTAVGSIASFDDGADSMLIKSLVADIEPQQDLHGYDHPWVGGSGKNLLAQKYENQTVSGVSFTWDNQGVIHCSGTPNATFIYNVNGGDPFMLDAGTYYLSGKDVATTAGSTAIMLRTVRTSSSSNVVVNDEAGQSVSFTLNEATSLYPIIYISSKAAPIDGVTFSPMIRLSSETDDSYESYENFCPITGYTEINVPVLGKNFIDNSLKFLNMKFLYYGATDDQCHMFLKAGTYTLSCKFLNGAHYGAYFKTPDNPNETMIWAPNATTISSGTIVLSEDTYVAFWFYYSGGCSEADVTDVQLELGSTVTDYEEHVKHVTTVSWQSSAGTVYGGSIDVVSGKLIINKIHKHLSELTWTKNTSFTCMFNGNGFTERKTGITSYNNPDLFCDTYPWYNSSGANAINNDAPCGIAFSALLTNSKYLVYVRDERYSTLEEWTASLQEHDPLIVCPLATPREVQLTPQEVECLLGVNNIWADAGDVTVTYPVDTKTYIDRKIQEAISGLSGS